MVNQYTDDGVWLLQTQNVREFFLSAESKTQISKDFHTLLAKSIVRKGDILIARSGSFGTASIYLGEEEINSADIIILEATPEEINRYVLTAFLNCTYGVRQLVRFASGGVQGHVNLRILGNLKVPKFSDAVSDCVEAAIVNSYSHLTDAEQSFEEARRVLLAELGLADWQPKPRTQSIRSFSDVFGARRMDAEYYQPKYDEIVDAIKGYQGGWDTLGNLACVKDFNFEPDDTAVYKYIELANIGGNGEVSDCTTAPGAVLPTRARRKVATGDVIVSSIEGSLSSIAVIDGEFDGALCSTGFHTVDSQTFNPETLMVLLKSIVGQLQLKKGCSGTILTAINQHELRKVVLPILSDYTQAEIQRMVKESVALRRKSRELLEYAKRVVEIAIEQDETTAIAWLEAKMDEPDGRRASWQNFVDDNRERRLCVDDSIDISSLCDEMNVWDGATLA